MKYIKINTPLQVVGGFSTAQSIVSFVTRDLINYQVEVYKDYKAFNNNEAPLKLKSPLPSLILMELDLQTEDYFGDYTRDKYLSILKANDYDAEIVDTDVKAVDKVKAYFVDKGLKEFDKTCGWDNKNKSVDRIVSALCRIEQSIDGLSKVTLTNK